ncbi:MAG TPA: chemotaxis protein CheW [Methanospirillum sp.]|nr:chemotaxis protein CheW [Methanospirillum sp.]
MTEYLLFMVDSQKFGIPVSHTDHVVRMVMITPIIAAPKAVAGIVNYHGVILPVFSVRRRFLLNERSPGQDDVLIIAGTMRRKVALIADQILGVVDLSEELITAEKILPGITGVRGVIRTGDGMILISDLDDFLLPEEEESLITALAPDTKGNA